MDDGMGNFTMMIARSHLNMTLQKMRQPTNINVQPVAGRGTAQQMFKASMRIFVPNLRQYVDEHYIASSKKEATNQLALLMCQKMFAIGAMKPYKRAAKCVADKMEPPPVGIPPELKSAIGDLLTEMEITPPEQQQDDESTPLFLPVDDAAPDQLEQQDGDCLGWTPPSDNFCPWRMSDQVVHAEAYPRAEEAKLPTLEYKERILRAVNDNSIVLVTGQTGCGKTTQVPQYILDDAIKNNQFCNVVVTQPRRIAAVSLAARVAAERNEELGESIGHSVRFDSVFPRSNQSLIFCTAGVLLKKFDGGLNGISHIILDEVRFFF